MSRSYTRPLHSRSTLFSIVALSAIGCAEVPTQTQAPVTFTPLPTSNVIVTYDDEMARLARDEIPGFGGYYLDADGTTVVQMVEPLAADSTARLVSRIRVEQFLVREQERMQLSPRPARYLAARYDFNTLKQYHDALMRFLDQDRVYLFDIDERTNRVYVGVASMAVRDDVLERARADGVPTEALDVQVMARPERRTSYLTGYWRPIGAGLQIVNSGGGICTLGFNAIVDGVDRFFTASHCSGTQYALDGWTQSQGGYTIGTEAMDPGLQFPCPSGSPFQPCRFSDASMYTYSAGAAHAQGKIMQTGYPVGGADGPIWIDESTPYFDIRWKWASTTDAPVGTELHKMGRTSGWTGGNVTRACVSLYELRCQWESNIWSKPGDSGSPIFKPSTNPWPSASLHGVLWGGPSGNWNVTWHSPLYGIERDFGKTLNVTIPPPPPPPPSYWASVSGPDNVQPYASCFFLATTNVPNPSYTWTVNGNYVGGDYGVYYANQGYFFQIDVAISGSGGEVAYGSKMVNVEQNAGECYAFLRAAPDSSGAGKSPTIRK